MKNSILIPLLIVSLLSSFNAFSQRRLVGLRVDGEMIFNKPSLFYTEDGGVNTAEGKMTKGQGFGLTEFLFIPIKRNFWFGQEASYMFSEQKFTFDDGSVVSYDYNPIIFRLFIEKRVLSSALGIHLGAAGSYDLQNSNISYYDKVKGNTSILASGFAGINILFRGLNVTGRFNMDINEGKYKYVREANADRYYTLNQRRQTFLVGLGLRLGSE